MNFAEIMTLPVVYTSDDWHSIERIACNVCRDYGSRFDYLAAMLNQLSDVNSSEFEIEAAKRFVRNDHVSLGDDKWGITAGVLLFDGKPFIGFTQSGRYQEEYTTYLFDKELWTSFVAFITESVKKYCENAENLENELVFAAPEQTILPEMVGNYKLDDEFNLSGVAEYQVGDLVWAWVAENHMSYDSKYVLVKVEIQKVNPKRKYEQYYGWQQDRSYCPEHPSRYFVKKGETMGAVPVYVLGRVSDMEEPEESAYKLIDENTSFTLTLEELAAWVFNYELNKHNIAPIECNLYELKQEFEISDQIFEDIDKVYCVESWSGYEEHSGLVVYSRKSAPNYLFLHSYGYSVEIGSYGADFESDEKTSNISYVASEINSWKEQ